MVGRTQEGEYNMGKLSSKCNYVTCPRGHKVFIVWSKDRNCFAFTCDECNQHSLRAVSAHGVIEIKVTNIDPWGLH